MRNGGIVIERGLESAMRLIECALAVLLLSANLQVKAEYDAFVAAAKKHRK